MLQKYTLVGKSDHLKIMKCDFVSIVVQLFCCKPRRYYHSTIIQPNVSWYTISRVLEKYYKGWKN